MNKIPIIAIIGPTAVGKTMFSLELAKKLNAEVISVDSRQVYRYLNVGTDKVDGEIRKEVLHHLIDIVDPDQIFSAADFALQTEDAVKRIRARGRVPLLIGGTPFYYKALTGSLSSDLPKDADMRAMLEREISERGLNEMHEELTKIDPCAASKIHPNDPVRIMRALEIFRLTGKNASWWYENQEKIDSRYEILYLGLIRERSTLYNNIENRVKVQFASGYPEEVEWLLKQGYSRNLPSMQGFGYRELVQYTYGECTFEEALLGDIRSTKAFSRRQMTWFKHFEPAVWYNFDTQSVDEVLKDALEKSYAHLDNKNSSED